MCVLSVDQEKSRTPAKRLSVCHLCQRYGGCSIGSLSKTCAGLLAWRQMNNTQNWWWPGSSPRVPQGTGAVGPGIRSAQESKHVQAKPRRPQSKTKNVETATIDHKTKQGQQTDRRNATTKTEQSSTNPAINRDSELRPCASQKTVTIGSACQLGLRVLHTALCREEPGHNLPSMSNQL